MRFRPLSRTVALTTLAAFFPVAVATALRYRLDFDAPLDLTASDVLTDLGEARFLG